MLLINIFVVFYSKLFSPSTAVSNQDIFFFRFSNHYAFGILSLRSLVFSKFTALWLLIFFILANFTGEFFLSVVLNLTFLGDSTFHNNLIGVSNNLLNMVILESTNLASNFSYLIYIFTLLALRYLYKLL